MNVKLFTPDGFFVATAHSIGSTDDELAALERSDPAVTTERKEILAFFINEAMNRLRNVAPMGLC